MKCNFNRVTDSVEFVNPSHFVGWSLSGLVIFCCVAQVSWPNGDKHKYYLGILTIDRKDLLYLCFVRLRINVSSEWELDIANFGENTI